MRLHRDGRRYREGEGVEEQRASRKRKAGVGEVSKVGGSLVVKSRDLLCKTPTWRAPTGSKIACDVMALGGCSSSLAPLPPLPLRGHYDCVCHRSDSRAAVAVGRRRQAATVSLWPSNSRCGHAGLHERARTARCCGLNRIWGSLPTLSHEGSTLCSGGEIRDSRCTPLCARRWCPRPALTAYPYQAKIGTALRTRGAGWTLAGAGRSWRQLVVCRRPAGGTLALYICPPKLVCLLFALLFPLIPLPHGLLLTGSITRRKISFEKKTSAGLAATPIIFWSVLFTRLSPVSRLLIPQVSNNHPSHHLDVWSPATWLVRSSVSHRTEYFGFHIPIRDHDECLIRGIFFYKMQWQLSPSMKIQQRL